MNGSLQSLTIAIPARNAAATLPRCLAAIAKQRGLGAARQQVVVIANDCTDDTAAIARAAAWEIDIICHETDLPRARANAGCARRLSMEMSADLTSTDGILVSTDADAVADEDWLQSLLLALKPDVAAVAGRVSWNGGETSLLAGGNLERRYPAALAEIEALLAPKALAPLAHDGQPQQLVRAGTNFAVWRTAVGTCWRRAAAGQWRRPGVL